MKRPPRWLAWLRYLTGRCVLCGKTSERLCFDCYWLETFGDDTI